MISLVVDGNIFWNCDGWYFTFTIPLFLFIHISCRINESNSLFIILPSPLTPFATRFLLRCRSSLITLWTIYPLNSSHINNITFLHIRQNRYFLLNHNLFLSNLFNIFYNSTTSSSSKSHASQRSSPPK